MRTTAYTDFTLYAKLLAKARVLISENSNDEDTKRHALQVHQIVEQTHHWDDPDYDLFLAALLHVLFERNDPSSVLLQMGFLERTVELARLGRCSFRPSIEEKFNSCEDPSVWIIELAHLEDKIKQHQNTERGLHDCGMLTEEAELCLRKAKNIASVHRYHFRLKNLLNSDDSAYDNIIS